RGGATRPVGGVARATGADSRFRPVHLAAHRPPRPWDGLAVSARLRVGVVGCGLIGRRRAIEAGASPHTECAAVADRVAAAANETAGVRGAGATDDWPGVEVRQGVDGIVGARPNG